MLFRSHDYIEYISHSFPPDSKKHLRVEPDLPYRFDFYSGTYNRGEDITYEQFLEYQRQGDCDYFFKNLIDKKYINLILHKSKIPVFMQDSFVVNIIIDTPEALELSQRLLWLKHYQIISNNLVKRLPHDPTTCNQQRSHIVQEFFKESADVKVNTINEFYTTEIKNNFEFVLFQDVQHLLNDQTNNTCTQGYFYLSNIFNKNKLIKNINDICEQYNLQPPSQELISLTYDMWWHSQDQILQEWDLND